MLLEIVLNRSIRDSETFIDFVQGPPGSRRERVKAFLLSSNLQRNTEVHKTLTQICICGTVQCINGSGIRRRLPTAANCAFLS